MIKKLVYILLFLVVAGLAAGYYARQEVVFTGKTMGTSYHVKVITAWFNTPRLLAEKIETRLAEINQSMSVFRKDSEISRFNRLRAVEEKFAISEDFHRVMVTAAQLHEWTNQAWDGTLMPLVNLWGFGYKGSRDTLPDPETIRTVQKNVGFHHIIIGPGRFLTKTRANVTLDLGSIAKGYGVDQVSQLLREKGYSNFLVEIGGEVFAAGVRKDRKPWRVGINRPEKDAPPTQVYRALALNEQALATSGDYRNFFEIDGVRYSHVIDPRTGNPVTNGVVSASILADNCTLADGLATAIMVMGHQSGLTLVNRLPKVESVIVVREPDGTLTDYLSNGFRETD